MPKDKYAEIRSRIKLKESTKRRQDNQGSKFNKAFRVHPEFPLYTIKKEDTLSWDFLPYTLTETSSRFAENYADPGYMYYERTFYVHRGLGPNEETHVCPAKTYGKPCCICDHINQLSKDYERHKDYITSFKAKQRQLFCVWDNDQQKIMIFEYAFWNFGRHLDNKVTRAKEGSARKYFWCPETGCTLILNPSSQSSGGSRSYFEINDIEFEERDEPIPLEILDRVPNLDDFILETSNEDLAALYGMAEDEEGEPSYAPEDEKPVRTTSTAGTEQDIFTAEEFGISVGDSVGYEGREWEVIRISPDGTSLYLEDSEGTRKRGIGPNEVEVWDAEPMSEEEIFGEESEEEPEPEEEDIFGDEEDSPKPKTKPRRKRK